MNQHWHHCHPKELKELHCYLIVNNRRESPGRLLNRYGDTSQGLGGGESSTWRQARLYNPLVLGIIDGSRRAADAFMQVQENVSPAQGVAACAVRVLLYVQLDFVHEWFSPRLHDILAFMVIGQTDMWRLWVLAWETNQVLVVSFNIQCFFCGVACLACLS